MLDQSISAYIWRHTKPQQLWILLIVALSMIPYFMSFNLPKQIVNGPIQGQGFETQGASQLFLLLVVDLPGLGEVTLFPGVALERLPMLMALSFVFLGLVIVNGLFKYYINTYKGRLGERLLRRMRFELVDRILRFPPAAFKRMKSAEISSMVKDEVEPIGGFTGDAFVAPALLGGQALTALVFIFVQNVPLGLITAALVSVQVFIIPRMRKRLLILGRERQLTARELAGRVSEIVDGIQTIHSYDTSNFERADIAARLGRIFKIRYEIYQWKFLVKFINNFLASVTPFLFYAVGGYLALRGRLDIGQLVAVIGAYKDLPGPLKELIDWDQARQDVQVKYSQVVGRFAIDGMIDADIHTMSRESAVGKLNPPLAATSLKVTDDTGALSLERVNFTLRPGERVSIIGTPNAGADTLAEALGRVVLPSGGRITVGDADLHSVPEAISGRSITYAAGDAYFFFGTVSDNLLYGLKNAPYLPHTYEGDAIKYREWEISEAKLAGNPDFDPLDDWIDLRPFGEEGAEGLMRACFAALDVAGLTKDLLDLALRSTIDPARHGDLANKIVDMRAALLEDLQGKDLQDLIVPFEPGAYNIEATVIENLLFCSARTSALMPDAIMGNAHFLSVLAKHGLDKALFETGMEVARNAIELFSDLPPDHPFFQQLTFMTPEQIPEYTTLLNKIDGDSGVTEADRARMVRLSFDYIEPRHRFGLLTDELMAEILAFRRSFHDTLPEELRDAVDFYDPERYVASAGLLDNMLFGRISQKYRDGSDRIYAAVGRLLELSGIHGTVLAIGLEYHVGAGGKRLSASFRQRLALARALLRHSDYYVFNRPLSALDARSQEQIVQSSLAYLRETRRNPGVAWVVSSPGLSSCFDRVAVFDKGMLAEEGTPEELLSRDGLYKSLVTA